MNTFRKVALTFENIGDTPSVKYDVQYVSGERATGTADRAFAMQLVSQFYPTEMTLLQNALFPSVGATTPAATTTTSSTTTSVSTSTVPGVNVKVGL